MLSGPGLFLSYTPLNSLNTVSWLKVTTDSFCAGAGAAFLYTDSSFGKIEIVFIGIIRSSQKLIYEVFMFWTPNKMQAQLHTYEIFLFLVELDTYLFSGCVSDDGTD